MKQKKILGLIMLLVCLSMYCQQKKNDSVKIVLNTQIENQISCKKNYIDKYSFFENSKDSIAQNWLKKESAKTKLLLEKIPNWENLSSKIRELGSRKSHKTYWTSITPKGEYFYLKESNGIENLYFRKSYNSKEEELYSPKNFKLNSNINYTIEYLKPSWDGKFVAIALSSEGKEFSEIIILDKENKKILPHIIDQSLPASFFGIDWLPDNSGFTYLRFNTTDNDDIDVFKNTASVLYKLGDDPKKTNVIFSTKNNPELEINPDFFPIVDIPSADKKYMIGYVANISNHWDAYYSEVENLKGDLKSIKWKKLYRKEDQAVKRVHTITKKELIYKSSEESSNNKILIKKLDNQEDLQPKILVHEKKDEVINDFVLTPKGLLYTTTENAVKARLYFKGNNGDEKEIKLPKKSGNIKLSQTGKEKTKVWITTSGWLNNEFRYEYDIETNTFDEKPLYTVATYPEFKDFVIEEITVESHDGEEIPLSLIYSKNTKKNKTNPLLIHGYGAYGDVLDPYFSTTYLSWVSEGGIYAVAHVRGGGAKGDYWHKNGYKDSKSNTWKDLISCTKYLIQEKYTSQKNIAVLGVSAGGIMAGRAIVEEPGLFSVAIINSGLLNPFRYESAGAGTNNTEEFGSVENINESEALIEMDSYMSITKKESFPAILTTVGLNDIRVPTWMSSKFVSKIRDYNKSSKPILFEAISDRGHFDSGSKKDIHEKWGKIFSFALWQTGHPDYQID